MLRRILINVMWSRASQFLFTTYEIRAVTKLLSNKKVVYKDYYMEL